ncbi:hypothetical protein NQD34_013712 [Periophthalmus magnuspinnatus]|uniref:zinc finger protein 572-like n=1 Tax=Periophthalmus magnuspinnatus TaxID=409849 RepID=UPI0022BAC23A|nr:zinc finger protein 572-like [Periophthalmus magnuspinnatus]KAJ0006439.1 hypothetical protein NQD34_013712 [Periophthalmus magnuspinnatus]
MTVVCRAGVQIPPLSPGPGLKQETPETPQVKEEPQEWSIKQEEEQLQVSVTGSSTVCVKTEDSSLLQTKHKEETQGEDVSSETRVQSETWETEGDTEHSSDNDEDWRAPLSCSNVQMEIEDDGDQYNQVLIRARSTTAQNPIIYKPIPETSAAIYIGDMSRTAERVPTGDKSYNCSICKKDFTNISGLIYHKRTHTGEKPYSCSVCNTRYTSSSNLKSHMRSHSGEKPYSCSICNSWFTSSSNLKRHMGSHSGEKPFGCSNCEKTFARKSHLEVHMRTHTGEKPFSCSVCNARFALNAHLKSHMRCHTGDK